MLVDDKEEKDLAVGFGMSLEVILFLFSGRPLAERRAMPDIYYPWTTL